MYETWDTQKRIGEAKRLIASVVDHLQYLLDIHENNAVVLYSDTLSKQIPKSYAANAFNVFREAMHVRPHRPQEGRMVVGTAKVNVAVEAAVRQGWDEIIGSDGAFVGMTTSERVRPEGFSTSTSGSRWRRSPQR